LSELPQIKDDIVRKFPQVKYWTKRLAQAMQSIDEMVDRNEKIPITLLSFVTKI
jgi:hypothetical protein